MLQPNPPTPRTARTATLLGAVGALILASGCNSASSVEGGTNAPGSVRTNPNTGLNFIVDPSSQGRAAQVRVTRVFRGRLVRVEGLDGFGARRTMHEEFVIGANFLGDGIDTILETNQITAEQTLVILRDVTDMSPGGGRAQFYSILKNAAGAVQPVADNGFTGVGSYSMVPRNAAFVVQFDDLIDPSTISDRSFRLRVGVPTNLPFEARVFPDQNYGDVSDIDGDGTPEFYPTRVVVDPAVSELESFSTNPPLPVNTRGLPASINVNLSNVQVRIPTSNTGQSELTLLQNPTGHALTTANNGSVDFSALTQPIVRAFRSGGNFAVTGDPYNGFLRDESPPRVVGAVDVSIDAAPQPDPAGDEFSFILPQVTFASIFCSQQPTVGDIITQEIGVFAEITGAPSISPGGVVTNLPVRVLIFPNVWGEPSVWETSGTGPAQYLVPYDPIDDVGREACFVEITPTPTGFITNDDPSEGVFTSSTFGVRFNEPVDPATVEPYDTLSLTRRASPREALDHVPVSVQQSLDLQQFVLVPDQPLAHELGNEESYFVRLLGGDFVPRDLAGNELQSVLPTIEVTVEPTAPSEATGGRVVLFGDTDEEWPFDDPANSVQFPEWNGQHVFDFARQLIRPRPVVRDQRVVDSFDTYGIIGAMTQATAGVNVPVNTLGAKTQFLWRYVDLGLQLQTNDDLTETLERGFLNMDVEGVSISPLGGQVLFENYPEFEIRMGHSFFLPDEALDPFGNIAFPSSGLAAVFEGNYLNVVEDPPTIVHERFRGFTINPGDIFTAPTGTRLMPLPLNRNVSETDKRYYTWRDTALQSRAGPNGFGAQILRWYQITGGALPIIPGPMGCPPMDPGVVRPFYNPTFVQTSALPLLMEFRSYPHDGQFTQNVWDTRTAHPTQTTPFFRAFSEGGFDTTGQRVEVDPELETTANGGFNPASTPPGQPTPGNDNNVYIGALDLVVRVSRSTSLFYPVVDPLLVDENDVDDDPGGTFNDPFHTDDLFQVPEFLPATTVPGTEDQPQGTRLDLAFRGAIAIANPETTIATTDGTLMDPYGDFYDDPTIESMCDMSLNHDGVAPGGTANDNVTFLGNNPAWFEDISMIDTSRWIQVRASFTNNVETGLTASLSALALSWREGL